MKSIFVLSTALVLTAACSKNDGRLKEKAKLEQESQVSVENQALAKKAEAMEKDLSRRHRFYQAAKGTYEGEIVSDLGTFNIRVTLTPTLAPIQIDRVRQLDEITADLNNLSLNTQVVQWDAASNYSGVGCRVSGVRPNIETGEIVISAESCPNLYTINITDSNFSGNRRNAANNAQRVAQDILDERVVNVESIYGEIKPSTNSLQFSFTARKVKE